MLKEMARQKIYSVVIPAWNEERTIKEVISVFRAHPGCFEIIVVSDGSTDKTAEVAREAGATVIELPQNVGKGKAMDKGVEAAKMDIIFFSDGDILGLTSEIISSISTPVLDGRYAMSMGIQGRSIYWLNRILHFFPLLGGQRVLTKELWYSVPKIYRDKFKIETALNYYSKKFGKTAHFALFPNMRQVKKEVKYGFLTGFWGRIKMFAEVFVVSVQLYIFDRIFMTLSAFRKKVQKKVQEKATATYPR
jgi:glycosyltransferase involved in cell wall biosynthesis